MFTLKRYTFLAVATALAAATTAYAQINSAVIHTHVFNDVPGSVPTAINLYPASITLGETGMSAPTGFADRDVWQFSNNGSTAYGFGPSSYFFASMNVTLTANDTSIDNEAGFLFSTASSGDIQLIVKPNINGSGTFVGQFGGISFWNSGLTYTLGQTVNLGLKYFYDTANSANALQFEANGIFSPVYDFGPTVGAGAADIGAGSTLGGYYQIQNDPNNPANAGQAIFGNITIVPEPSAIALAGLGLLPLILRRRRS
ncbi:exported hypothetical protein [Verrucomicrobia bacterium]|nr:exported hypothetical protein [Verrucomicrobiota bacterium]